MRHAQALLLFFLSAATFGILAHSSLFLQQGDWAMLLGLAILIAASNYMSLTTLSVGDLSFLAGGIMVAFLIGGPHVALWALAIGTLVESLIHSGYLLSLVYNVTGMAVASWVSFSAYGLMGGQWGSAFDHPVQAGIMALIFMVTNTALYALILHVIGEMDARRALKAMLDQANVRAYLIILAMGILVGFSYIKGGLLWGVATIVLAWMLQAALRHYFDMVTEARSQTQQLEVVLNATRGALVMTDRQGIIQVANRQMGVLFSVTPEQMVGQPESSIPELQAAKRRIAAVPDEQVQQVIELTSGPARFVHWYRAAVQNSQGAIQGHIEVYSDVTALKEAEENLRQLYNSMIRALTAAIDARDSYTHGHSARVSSYSVTIAEEMGLPPEDLERIGYSGLVHDIGKLGIDDKILRKRGALTPGERALMMQHPAIGATVLERANVLAELIPGVRWHHEWVSGGGYPDGLQGDQIPLDARIIGVADALDAMTSDRPYRPAMSPQEALQRIQESAGVQFDPKVVEALTRCVAADKLVICSEPESEGAQLGRQEEGVIRPVHGKELSIFYQLSREDYAALTLEGMLRRYLETFSETIAPHVYLVYLVQPETGRLVLESSLGLNDWDCSPTKTMTLVEEAVAKQQTVHVPDLRHVAEYRPAAVSSKAEVVVPLVAQEEVLGALVVEAAQSDLFDRDDIYLLEALGERLSSAIKLVRYHERLTFAAAHDGLTGVFNHSHFYNRLTEAVEQGRRGDYPVSVLLLDLNGLKAINDTYGHLAGDEALRQYGRLLRQRVRPEDMVARYGGDEFAVIMPRVGRTDASRMAFRLKRELQRSFLHNGQSIPLPSASWGIASYPEDGARAAELVHVADRAMYQEKRSDRAMRVQNSNTV